MIGMLLNSFTLRGMLFNLRSTTVKPQTVELQFTASSVFNKPDGITTFDVTLVGGGGSGGPATDYSGLNYVAGGGGAGYASMATISCPAALTTYNLDIGLGYSGVVGNNPPLGWYRYSMYGTNGGTTTLRLGAQTLLNAYGGHGGWYPYNTNTAPWFGDDGYGGLGDVTGGGSQNGTPWPSAVTVGHGGTGALSKSMNISEVARPAADSTVLVFNSGNVIDESAVYVVSGIHSVFTPGGGGGSVSGWWTFLNTRRVRLVSTAGYAYTAGRIVDPATMQNIATTAPVGPCNGQVSTASYAHVGGACGNDGHLTGYAGLDGTGGGGGGAKLGPGTTFDTILGGKGGNGIAIIRYVTGYG